MYILAVDNDGAWVSGGLGIFISCQSRSRFGRVQNGGGELLSASASANRPRTAITLTDGAHDAIRGTLCVAASRTLTSVLTQCAGPVYGLDWCKTTGSGPARGKSYFRLALASFTEDYRNRISIVGLADERSLIDDEPGDDFVPLAQTMHGYPATKIQWQPASAAAYQWNSKSAASELLATSGDCLRVWEYTTDNAIKTENYVGGRPVTNGHKLAQKIALSGVRNIRMPIMVGR